ncbi:RNA-binding protein [Bacillus sp. V3B]|uniref:YlmH family RNA-binding protein n=1 Tax=Bacillus sp. V3B TaxID=2804915 RepID=UPI0021095EFA|nr:RNA-binding protein [Bacillus sp. V3B]MCQ6274019.1 RNA-binding protein [Bacillus sp. V3B]
MSIYQHFRPEERNFIDQVLNWKEYVEQTYSPKLTDFLDPREQQIVKIIIGGQADLKWAFLGGSDQSERKRAFLFPEYHQLEEDDFKITLFEIHYPQKFINLTHPQVLGSLMSLGLKREKFGDIVTVGERIQFFCAEEVANYVNLELQSVGRAKVELIQKPLAEGLIQEDHWNEQIDTVSSLRLDTVIASLFKLSRQKSQALIGSGLVKVNWTCIENAAFECGEGDTISVRGYGRGKIFSIEGKTKKDKWRIFIGRQK